MTLYYNLQAKVDRARWTECEKFCRNPALSTIHSLQKIFHLDFIDRNHVRSRPFPGLGRISHPNPHVWIFVPFGFRFLFCASAGYRCSLLFQPQFKTRFFKLKCDPNLCMGVTSQLKIVFQKKSCNVQRSISFIELSLFYMEKKFMLQLTLVIVYIYWDYVLFRPLFVTFQKVL